MSVAEQRYEVARQAYYDNADWQDYATTTKAKLFRTALVRLIGLVPSRAEHSGESQEFHLPTLHKLLEDVKTWIAVVDDTNDGGYVDYDLSEYRT